MIMAKKKIVKRQKFKNALFNLTKKLVGHNSCLENFLPKVNDSKGSTTTGIVNDVLDDTLDVAVSFSIVDGSEPGGSLPVFRVGHEN